VIKKAFVGAFNCLIDNKEEITNNYDDISKKITDYSKEEKEIEKIEVESQVLQTSIERLISENARTTIDQMEYAKKYNNLVQKHNDLQKRLQTLLSDIDKKNAKRTLMKAFLKILKEQKHILTEFDESVWSATLKYVEVKSNKELVFNFKDGKELPEHPK